MVGGFGTRTKGTSSSGPIEASKDILKLKIPGNGISRVFKSYFPLQTPMMFFRQNTRRAGNNAAEMSRRSMISLSLNVSLI